MVSIANHCDLRQKSVIDVPVTRLPQVEEQQRVRVHLELVEVSVSRHGYSDEVAKVIVYIHPSLSLDLLHPDRVNTVVGL